MITFLITVVIVFTVLGVFPTSLVMFTVRNQEIANSVIVVKKQETACEAGAIKVEQAGEVVEEIAGEAGDYVLLEDLEEIEL